MIKYLLVTLTLVGYLLTSGCRTAQNESFTPPEDGARQALSAALDQWKAGSEIGPIEGKPAIHIADTHRKPGQQLLSYAIQGELPLDVGHRYQVKLQLANPNAEEKVQYVIVGKDPLWVFRQEDYDMLAHWDMNMPAESIEPKAGTQ